MACSSCWAVPQLPRKHSYLVQLSNALGEPLDIVVQTSCLHDLQSWVDENAALFSITNPKVINVDAKRASHIPIIETDRAG